MQHNSGWMVGDLGGEFLLDFFTAGKEKGDFRPRPEGILPDQVLRDGLSDDDPL